MAATAFAQELPDITPMRAAAFPDLAYTDDQGKTHSLRADKGTLTVVHFWATWCVPCVEEFPKIDAAQQAYADRGLKIIAISLDGDSNMPKVKKFFADNHIAHMAPYLDHGTSAFTQAGVRGLPTSFFLDAEGMKIGVAEGPMDWDSKANKAFMEPHLKHR
jgi:thiol-disulfide isomerase/thioredoxin